MIINQNNEIRLSKVGPEEPSINAKRTKLSVPKILATRRNMVFIPAQIISIFIALFSKKILLPALGIDIFILPFLFYLCSLVIFYYCLYQLWKGYAFHNVKNVTALGKKLGMNHDTKYPYSRLPERLVEYKYDGKVVEMTQKDTESLSVRKYLKHEIKKQNKKFLRSLGKHAMPETFRIKSKKDVIWSNSIFLFAWILFSGIILLAFLTSDAILFNSVGYYFGISMAFIAYISGLRMAYLKYKAGNTNQYLKLTQKGIETHLSGFLSWEKVKSLEVNYFNSPKLSFSRAGLDGEEKSFCLELNEYKGIPYPLENLLQYYSEQNVVSVNNRLF